MDTSSPPAAAHPLARLRALDVKAPWQAALLLPVSYVDPPETLQDHRLAQEDLVYAMHVRVAGAPRTFFNGAPRVVVVLADARDNTFSATVFGNTADWKARLVEGSEHLLSIRFRWYSERLSGTVLGLVEDVWSTRLRPVYPSVPAVITSDEVRDLVLGVLPRIVDRAAAEICRRLEGLGDMAGLLAELEAGGWTLKQVLQQAHAPRDRAYAEFAREVLLKLAALDALASAQTQRVQRGVAPMSLPTLTLRKEAFPFTLSEEQSAAIDELAQPLRAGRRLNGVLLGDVGSGKTACFGALAAAVVDANRRVAVLLPSTVLAEQVHRELNHAFPDIGPALVTGESEIQNLKDAAWVVGTSAVLHRETGTFDLVVVDEEQRFSVEQKSQLVELETHLLLVSATCIPRTQALARYGAATVAVLPAGHARRCITTRVHEHADRSGLFAEVRSDVRQGVQVIVVYPLRGDTEIDAGHDVGVREADRRSVRGAYEGWCKVFPAERIRMLTGDTPDDEKRETMRAMRAREADILLSTTVVEVGVTLPGVRRVIVVDPQRFGLSQLHQLRGRAARSGGEGWFDLLLREPISDKTRERLSVLVQHANGFEVSLRDLEQRGYGDLGEASRRQAGASGRVLFGQACPVAITDAVYPIYQRRAARSPGRASPVDLLAGQLEHTGPTGQRGSGAKTAR
ncbi:DEAD/DEAH box helicase [Aquimonas sp.]|jgi:ATP-dependent DNA helicase RecG|uniref:DEAD/DEAH box helicase n=1 Tax=Aquimonas sp. TaxID=1872588 RepID=UPI0037BF1EF4